MTTKTRPLYLLIYPRLSAAHWSLFIPSLASLAALAESPRNERSNNDAEKRNSYTATTTTSSSSSSPSSSSPSPSSPFPKKGKIIHVVGSPVTGFKHVIGRNYDISTDRFNMVMLEPLKLCDLEVSSNISIDDGDGKKTSKFPSLASFIPNENENENEEKRKKDTLESEALKVPAPGVSRAPMDPDSQSENCQSWVWAYIRHLIHRGIIRDGEAALNMLGGARMNPQN